MGHLNNDYVLNLFIRESIDKLKEISHTLLELEKNAEDPELIKTLFRSVHTLKGNATTTLNTISVEKDNPLMKLIENIGNISHDFETLMSAVRDGKVALNEERIDLLFETEDILETHLSYIENEINEFIDVEEIVNKLKESASEAEEKKDSSFSNEHHHVYEVFLSYEDENNKYAVIPMFYSDVKLEFDECIFSPSTEDLLNGASLDQIFLSIPKEHSVENVLALVKEMENVKDVVFISGSEETAEEPIENELLHEILTDFKKDTTTITTEQKEEIIDLIIDEKENIQKKETKKDTINQKLKNNKALLNTSDIRVSVNRIDEVLRHVSNLVILKNKFSASVPLVNTDESKLLKDISEDLSRTIDFLQESVMKIRMTPLNQLFDRFPKDVRNVAKEFNKKVNFNYIGGETEIDNSLLERLYDPLIHLIRNSIFHGLETKEERLALGKSDVGNLTLQAKHEEGWVVISVEDDGSGIDVEKVKNKAIKNGFIPKEKAKDLSDEEVVQFIFASGLSTAEKVNNFAGRGVGMDVVRTEIEDMRGSVHVYSKPNQGTKIVLKLPLTLAIIQALLATIDGETFAFPISQVEEVIEIKKTRIKHAANREIFLHRNQEIPIIRLNEFFKSSETKETETLVLIILKHTDKFIAVTVNEAEKNEDIVVKNIGEYLGQVPGISGCTILGDGSISLIIDVNNLVKSYQKNLLNVPKK